MAKKSLAGRKTKLTREVVKKLEEAFAIDATVSEACFYADISRETFYNWIREHKQLADRFEALREKPVLTARTTVATAIKTDPEMAMKYLERKRKGEFSPRIETDTRNRESFDETADTIKKLLEEVRKEPNADNGVQNRKGADVETSNTETNGKGGDNSSSVS